MLQSRARRPKSHRLNGEIVTKPVTSQMPEELNHEGSSEWVRKRSTATAKTRFILAYIKVQVTNSPTRPDERDKIRSFQAAEILTKGSKPLHCSLIAKKENVNGNGSALKWPSNAIRLRNPRGQNRARKWKCLLMLQEICTPYVCSSLC